MWSVGVVSYIVLAGYAPFREEDANDLEQEIRYGSFEFEEKFWGSISTEAKDFISALITVDPIKRITAPQALGHSWFAPKELSKSVVVKNETPVFFMIGSQRSGSNWLRTMLDEREDLVGPHPPHMVRDFMPILDKFGDLSVSDNFRVLVDHVCSFVENNQVPWTDKHGANLKFPRVAMYSAATASCERLRNNRDASGESRALESGFYLLSVFDSIMNFFTKASGKRIWMCKSMGMSKFHDLLLEFYGEKRLRYIYLVRDPRDVAMSFMKT
jgi:serine/threonine protein kinase